ncbi:MAG: hypothetical protein Q9221_008781 [Calogaya cf. arnoldii]
MEATNPHFFTLQDIDDASAALILQLQREDVEELQQSSKGKHREDEVSDADLAIELFQQDLQETSAVLSDRLMSRSLARAVVTDAAFLTDEVARQDTLANDRLVAERIQQGGEAESSKGTTSDPVPDDLLLARLTALYVSDPADDRAFADDDDNESTTCESSRWAAARPNSATCVENAGKPAFVLNGTNNGWNAAQNKSLRANSLSDLCLQWNRLYKSNMPSKTYALVTIAHMKAGAGSVAPINARSAITISHNTSSSASNARSEHAIGARGTDCEST